MYANNFDKKLELKCADATDGRWQLFPVSCFIYCWLRASEKQPDNFITTYVYHEVTYLWHICKQRPSMEQDLFCMAELEISASQRSPRYTAFDRSSVPRAAAERPRSIRCNSRPGYSVRPSFDRIERKWWGWTHPEDRTHWMSPTGRTLRGNLQHTTSGVIIAVSE